MEVLTAKIGILADLFGIIGIIGLAVLLAAVVWLVICVSNFDSVIPAAVCALAAIALIAGGLMFTPMPDFGAEPAKTAQKNTPDEGSGPADSESGGQQSSAASDTTQEGYLYETTLSGWRVRMTLPEEWRELCAIEDDEWSADFYQKSYWNTIYGGWLFSLSVIEEPFDDNHYGSASVVMEKEGVTLVAAYATDVQFDDQDSAGMEENSRMQDAIPGILDSIEFERA